jgi:hypothetical protein
MLTQSLSVIVKICNFTQFHCFLDSDKLSIFDQVASLNIFKHSFTAGNLNLEVIFETEDVS